MSFLSLTSPALRHGHHVFGSPRSPSSAASQSQICSAVQTRKAPGVAVPLSVAGTVASLGASVAPARLGLLAQLSAGQEQATELVTSFQNAAPAPATDLPLRSRDGAAIHLSAIEPSIAGKGGRPKAAKAFLHVLLSLAPEGRC